MLNEIAELKRKDPDDAWTLYHATFPDLGNHLSLIRQLRPRLGYPKADFITVSAI